MFTTVDKALTALIMAVLFLLNHFGIVPWQPTPEIESSISAILAALMPILVYAIPNKRP